MVSRCKGSRFKTVAGIIERRMWSLDWPWPDRDGAKSVEPAFPAKRLSFGQRPTDQDAGFLSADPRFVRVRAIRKKFIGCPTEKQHDQPPMAQLVKHR